MSQYGSPLPPMPSLGMKGQARGLNSQLGGSPPPVVGGAMNGGVYGGEAPGGGSPGSSASDSSSTSGRSATSGLSGIDAMGQDETDAGVPGYQSPEPGSISEMASNAVAKGMDMGAFGGLAQAGAAANNPGKVGPPSTVSAMTSTLGLGSHFGGPAPLSGVFGLIGTVVDQIANALGFGETSAYGGLAGLGLADFSGLSIGTDLAGNTFGATIGSPESFGVSIGDTSIGDPGSFVGDMGGEADNSDAGGLGGLGN